jgi:hypothetical protein
MEPAAQGRTGKRTLQGCVACGTPPFLACIYAVGCFTVNSSEDDVRVPLLDHEGIWSDYVVTVCSVKTREQEGGGGGFDFGSKQ